MAFSLFLANVLNLQQITLTSDHCPWPYSIVTTGSDLTFSKHHLHNLIPLSLTLPVVVSICWTDTPGRMMACTGNRADPTWPPEHTRRGTGVDIMGGTLAMGRLRGYTSLKQTHWPLHNGHMVSVQDTLFTSYTISWTGFRHIHRGSPSKWITDKV